MRLLPGADRRPTFLLGLGAQKAGTTWLYRYLQRSPEFIGGYRKEYHVFDCLDVPSQGWLRRRILEMASDELEKAQRGDPADAEQLHRASMYADPELYFDYFAGLLRSRPGAQLTGDLTPDHALLSAERLADIKASFARRGVRTVGVLLMRDPVDRIWSHIRMQHGRDPGRFPAPPEEMVAQLHLRSAYASRSRYERPLRAADATFGPGELYVGFYEELFDPAQVREICRFLGIRYRAPDLDRRVNVSAPKEVETLPEDVVSAAARHLSSTYIAVAERFPEKDITALWPSAKYVLP